MFKFPTSETGPNEHIIYSSHDIQTELQFILGLENSMWHNNLNLKHLYATYFFLEFSTTSDDACEIHLIGLKKKLVGTGIYRFILIL